MQNKTTKAAKAATPAKAAKPAAAKPDDSAAKAKAKADALAAETARCEALQATARAFYDGASAACHKAKPATLSAYIERVNAPVQRIGKNGLTVRDDSGLALALSGADATGNFCPVALNFDAGIISRLASVGMLSVTGDKLTLSADALSRAKLIVKRAA